MYFNDTVIIRLILSNHVEQIVSANVSLGLMHQYFLFDDTFVVFTSINQQNDTKFCFIQFFYFPQYVAFFYINPIVDTHGIVTICSDFLLGAFHKVMLINFINLKLLIVFIVIWHILKTWNLWGLFHRLVLFILFL